MEGTCEKDCEESLVTGVFELPGEPAVVIIGVPDVPMADGNAGISLDARTPRSERLASTDTGKTRNTGFGEWLEGREVSKLFGEAYYSGTVTQFDKETGWYRVVYEDGDFEDLEWSELQEVLQPLDITVPLKSLALKILRKSYQSEQGSERTTIAGADPQPRTSARRGRPRGSSSKRPSDRG